jgi:hypothetical protein
VKSIAMQEAYESRVVCGLNDYRFRASLYFEHLSISPDEATAALDRMPASTRRHGQPRTRPDGSSLGGVVQGNHWAADLAIVPGHDIPDFLAEFVDRLSAGSLKWMRRVADTGGCISVFFGIFADRLCDFEIPPVIFRKLGDAGVTIRFDFYGSNQEAEPGVGADSR